MSGDYDVDDEGGGGGWRDAEAGIGTMACKPEDLPVGIAEYEGAALLEDGEVEVGEVVADKF